MAEEDFVLSFTGEETDNLLKHTESMKNQTTAEDGETVQVYDTNGVPHKVSKTELLKSLHWLSLLWETSPVLWP